MRTITIRELSAFVCQKPHTIRRWEERFKFVNPQRNNFSKRLYSVDELNTIMNVTLLLKQGFRLPQIARMEDAEIRDTIAKTKFEQRTVNDLILSMVNKDVAEFDKLLDQSIACIGVDETITEVISSFCMRTHLFNTEITRSYEVNLAMVKDSLKRKIYFGIERNLQLRESNNLSVLIVALPGTSDDLPLLFTQYLLRTSGYQTFFVQLNRIEELKSIIESIKANYIISQVITSAQAASLRSNLQGQECIILGNDHPNEVVDMLERIKN